MMQLTVLGSHGPYAPVNGACSGYLLEVDGFTIMLDCGNGTFSKLQKYTDYTKLGILIISHLHPDHYSDIFCLRQAMRYAMREGLREEPLFVYLPEEPAPLVNQIRQWKEEFTVISLEEASKLKNDFQLFSLDFFPVKHSIPTYGVQLGKDNVAILTYTADTGWTPALEEHCSGTTFLLAEASLKDFELAERGDQHMTARQAGAVAQQAGADQLILTHLFPAYNTNQLRRQAEQVFDGKVQIAASGKTYILKDEPCQL